MFAAACIASVDFPIPGSPPRRITEPCISPPPSTLSNSAIPVFILSPSFAAIVSMVFRTNFDFEIVGLRLEVSIISSVKEFQLSHSGHFPSHLSDSYPQFEQMYFILVLDMLKKNYRKLPTTFSTLLIAAGMPEISLPPAVAR